jgi:hypothetical protein
MNDTDLDNLIGSALRARADQLTESDLSPALAPTSQGRRTVRWNWAVPLLAAAVVTALAVGSTVLVRSLASSHAKPAHSPVGSAPVSPTPSQSNSPTASPSPSSKGTASSPTSSHAGAPGSQFQLGYQPLWPFGSYAQAAAWSVQYRSQGSQPWHLDPAATALDFTRSYLGFTELDTVTSTRLDEQGAQVGVGYHDPNGTPVTSAVLHLVRYGSSTDSPWEVVGSDDTTFSLEIPAYGSLVGSPVTVGGHITGVDDSIRLTIRSLDRGVVSSPVSSIPAGGDNQPWHGTVDFSPGGVLTIVASTGGHLQAVERFAIQGVRS